MGAFEWIIVVLGTLIVGSIFWLAWVEKQTKDVGERLIQSNQRLGELINALLGDSPPRMSQQDQLILAYTSASFDEKIASIKAEGAVSTVETAHFVAKKPANEVAGEYPFVYRRGNHTVHRLDCWYAENTPQPEHPWAFDGRELADWLDLEENREMRACTRCKPLDYDPQGAK